MALSFSKSMLAALASPDMGDLEGLGRQIGSADAVAQEAERQKEFDANSFKLLRQGLFSADQGDVSALANRTNDLINLMNSTTDETDRATLQNMITQLDAQRSATQTTATTNTANSIIKTEQALEKLKSEMDLTAGPLPPQQQKVFDALTQRLDVMKQNSKAVIEADSIKYKAEVQTLERDALLREKRVEAATNVLASLNPNSKEYKDAVDDLESRGLGKAVRQDKEARQKLVKAEGEIREQNLKTGPLSSDEMQTAKEMGLSIKNPKDPLSRKLFNSAMEERIKEEVKIAIRPISTPEQARAEALAKAQLGVIARQGDFFDVPFYRDIATKIEDMSEEQTADLMGRIEGLAEAQIPNEVNAWLYENFPKEMSRSAKFAEKNKMDAEDIGRLTNSILRNQGINVADATEEQIAVAQRQAELAIAGAESALQRQAPQPGGEGRRQRRGPLQVAEPYTFDRKTGTGGQMSRGQNQGGEKITPPPPTSYEESQARMNSASSNAERARIFGEEMIRQEAERRRKGS